VASPQFRAAEEELESIVEPRWTNEMLVREHWVIGPEAR
jgi:hypothetical protein